MKQGRKTILLAVAVFCLINPVHIMAEPFLPVFDRGIFTADQPVDNPFFPIQNGVTRIYQAEGINEEGDFFSERFELTGLGLGPVILGVQTTVQRDRAYEDGLLVEDTFDYYAQDDFGNVWYMGEDVTNYVYDNDGNLIETNSSSSWMAGINGGKAGWIMPIDKTLGFNYYQEYAPLDGALDEATTEAYISSVSLGFGNFGNVLRVLETNPSGALEFKYYAEGFGLIMVEEGLDESLSNPELIFELVGTQAVPEPTSILLFGLGLISLAKGSRLKNRDKYPLA